jgi:hypothetical protein
VGAVGVVRCFLIQSCAGCWLDASPCRLAFCNKARNQSRVLVNHRGEEDDSSHSPFDSQRSSNRKSAEVVQSAKVDMNTGSIPF